MFVYSVNSSLIKKFGLVILISVSVMLVLCFSFAKKAEKPSSAETGLSYNASTSKERLDFISQFGWVADDEPCEVREIAIPDEFDEVYNNYNEIQKKQGLDLLPFKGKRVKRYTYIIRNYPGYSENDECIRINLLVSDGAVVGGDVCSVELDGFMHTFMKQ